MSLAYLVRCKSYVILKPIMRKVKHLDNSVMRYKLGLSHQKVLSGFPGSRSGVFPTEHLGCFLLIRTDEGKYELCFYHWDVL